MDPVQFLRGVGPEGMTLLGRLGISTVYDLLFHLPRRYEDRTHFSQIGDLAAGRAAVVAGRVLTVDSEQTARQGIAITRVTVGDGTGVVRMVFFRQPYLLRRFQDIARRGHQVVLYGTAKLNPYEGMELDHPEWEELLPEADPLSTNRIVPVYPLTEGLTQKRVRRAVDAALDRYADLVPEILPTSIVSGHQLVPMRNAVESIHFPATEAARDAARRRLVFEEFFVFQVEMARRRAARMGEASAPRMRYEAEQLNARLAAVLPFRLTNGQAAAVSDIGSDLARHYPMNRLVQGDVGSGKTAVAVAAMLLAVDNGYQSAMMAPTEVLAQQHASVLRRFLEPAGVVVELVTGSERAKSRRLARDRAASGDCHVVVGTHALIQESLYFKRLGLVIVDEQHRFGVLQRQALQQKGINPHVLVMTATPIPRTLTMTLYGDLDTSVISELPPGRKPVRTHWKRRQSEQRVYASVAQLLSEGRQAFVVCSLVEGSDRLQANAATELFETLQSTVLGRYRIGLLHGQMRPADKEAVMARFKAHEIDVLVSTTVIEVGVDVPNATVMVVEDAERFGLAQLHQLRGRVGRGEHSSYCILLGDPQTEDGVKRLEVMVATQDGFKIAEEDLRLRGPGEFFGTRQSGVPAFRFGDILQDEGLMREARGAAYDLVSRDANLAMPENSTLAKVLVARRDRMTLAQVS